MRAPQRSGQLRPWQKYPPTHPDTHTPCLSLPRSWEQRPLGGQESEEGGHCGAWEFPARICFQAYCVPQAQSHPFLQGLRVSGVNKPPRTKTARPGHGPEKGLVLAESIGEEKGPWALCPTGPKPQPGSP